MNDNEEKKKPFKDFIRKIKSVKNIEIIVCIILIAIILLLYGIVREAKKKQAESGNAGATIVATASDEERLAAVLSKIKGAGKVEVYIGYDGNFETVYAFDYSDRYSYYNVGGMATELYYHILRIGLLNFLLIGLGIADAFRRKRFALPALGACELAVSLVLFTRVQNTGSHQMLLFLPAYFLLFLAGAAALAEGIERRKALKLGYWEKFWKISVLFQYRSSG